MRTDLQTQIPLGVTRVQAASSASSVSKDNERPAAVVETSSKHSRSTINEKAKELEKEIKSLNEGLKLQNVELKFSVDDKTGIMVVKIVDSHTGDSLKQIPSEVSLKLAEVFGKLQINLFSSEV